MGPARKSKETGFFTFSAGCNEVLLRKNQGDGLGAQVLRLFVGGPNGPKTCS